MPVITLVGDGENPQRDENFFVEDLGNIQRMLEDGEWYNLATVQMGMRIALCAVTLTTIYLREYYFGYTVEPVYRN